MEGMQACSLCAKGPAVVTCNCENPKRPYCMDCFSGPHKSTKRGIHIYVSISSSVSPAPSSPRAHINNSNDSFSVVLSALQAQLEVISALQEHAISAFASVHRAVYESKIATLAAISSDYSDVERLIREFARSKGPETFCGRLIQLNLTEEEVKKALQISTFVVNTKDTMEGIESVFQYSINKAVLQRNLDGEMFTPYEARLLPYFDAENPQCILLPGGCNIVSDINRMLSAGLHPFSVAGEYAQGEIFFCGISKRKICLILNVEEMGVREVEDTGFHHCFPGLFVNKESVYLFGGREEDIPHKLCERLSKQLEHWSPLPQLHYPRHNFMPAAHAGEIFIIGGCAVTIAEVFTLISQSFRIVEIIIPGYRMNAATIAVGGDKEMVLFHFNGIFRWNLNEKTAKRVATLNFPSSRVISCCAPIRIEGDIFTLMKVNEDVSVLHYHPESHSQFIL